MQKSFLNALFLLLLLPTLAGANDKAIRDEVGAKVSQLVALLQDSYAQEFQKARGIKILKTGKDNAVIAVAIFTVEGFRGGNNFTQYMAVFADLSEESQGRPKRLSLLDFMEVGGRGMRYVDFNDIRMKKSKDEILITLSTLEYGPDDGKDPSIESKARFIIAPYNGGRLKEIVKEKGTKR